LTAGLRPVKAVTQRGLSRTCAIACAATAKAL